MSVPQNRRGIQRKCRIRARKVIRLQKSLDPSPASSSRVPRSPGMGQGGVDVEGPAMGMLGRASTGTRISKARKDKEAAAKFAQDDSNPGNLRLGVVDAQETQESAMPDGGDDESVSSQITTVASERCDVAPERSSHDSESVNETPAGVSPETTTAEHASLQSSNTPAAAVKQDEETVENDDNESLHEDVEGSSFEAPASDGPPSSSGRGPKRRLPSREPVRYWTEEEHRCVRVHFNPVCVRWQTTQTDGDALPDCFSLGFKSLAEGTTKPWQSTSKQEHQRKSERTCKSIS